VKLLEALELVLDALAPVFTDISDVLLWQPQFLPTCLQFKMSGHVVSKTTVAKHVYKLKSADRNLLPNVREGRMCWNISSVTFQTLQENTFVRHVNRL